jgi:hypothetical protein
MIGGARGRRTGKNGDEGRWQCSVPTRIDEMSTIAKRKQSVAMIPHNSSEAGFSVIAANNTTATHRSTIHLRVGVTA